MFCPACVSTLALAASTASAGVGTTAGLATLLRRRAARRATTHPTTEPPMTSTMPDPTIDLTPASRDEWLVARRALLAKEKEATRLRDAIAAERRALPAVRLDKAYAFDGPDGAVSLRDLFGPHPQLVVYHLMFRPEWDQACKACTYVMDNVAGGLPHLAAADTAFAAISRAPLAKLQAYAARMGWTFAWVSSGDTDFNYDFHVTLDPARRSTTYNYESAESLVQRREIPSVTAEMPAFSVFARRGDEVFHTYSCYQRGVDLFLNTYNLLDMTPLGRNEAQPMAWVKRRHEY